MNMEVVAVDTSTYSVYDFLKDNETKDELLKRANDAKQRDIESWGRTCEEYPDVASYKTYLKQAKAKTYEIMTWTEFEQRQRDYLLSDELTEITEEKYNDMLNILPPLKWCTIDGVEMFCMSEMYTASYTTQYAKCGDKYYSKMVDHRDKSTWIHNIIKRGEQN